MKIAWIFPKNKICGISFYSHAYVESLKPFVDVICIDPEDFVHKKADTVALLRQCQLAHIQYETSFFLNGQKDYYFDLCASIECPIVVTLHEVYEQFPGVFPRESIQGFFPFRNIKQWLYDRRHPYLTILTKHTSRNYCGRAILVHSQYQKDICVKKGIRPEIIWIFSEPVDAATKTPAVPWKGSGTFFLASSGFMNDSFDYDLLISTLAQCDLPWHFTWIGGTRRPDDNQILEKLKKEIDRRNWHNRFAITGIVSKEKRNELISKTHIYCAFFKYKSASGSLATAISGRSMIIATSLPILREMTEQYPMMMIAPSEPSEMVKAIRQLATDKDLQTSLAKALADYCNEYNRERTASRIMALYEKELA